MLVGTAQLSTWSVVGPQGRIQRTSGLQTTPQHCLQALGTQWGWDRNCHCALAHTATWKTPCLLEGPRDLEVLGNLGSGVGIQTLNPQICEGVRSARQG